MEDDKLFLFAALNDLRGSRVELGFDLVDDREDEGRKKAKDEDIELLCPWSISYLESIA